MITRFAPSPTGRLHLGHAYAAIVAHDLARAHGGRFLLRFEDIDHTRVRPEYFSAIEDDLRWLGLGWDGPALRQTTADAEERYRAALQRLADEELVYPCFCTRKEVEAEIASLSRAPHGPEGPLYPGTCRKLSPARRAELFQQHTAHCWRFDSTRAARVTGELHFRDLRHGRQPVDPALLGDVVLARKDIATSYHLAVVVDDAAQNVTHVTRGEDLLPSTHVHRLLQALLGLPEPLYLHHALVCDESGRRLAKRDQAASLERWRSRGATVDELRRRLPALPSVSLEI